MIIKCQEIKAAHTLRGMDVEIDLSLKDLIGHLDKDEILDVIGKDACIEYFGIEEVE